MADFDADLKAANDDLKRIRAGVAIRRKGGRLYLRATLPPKPDSDRPTPHQQDCSLGVYANPAGLKFAKDEAKRMSSDLGHKRFEWVNWGYTPKIESRTVAEWSAAFEADYFDRNERNQASETTWHKDYHLPIQQLPQDGVLTEKMMLDVILSKDADSRSRKRFCDTYGRLAVYAGLEIDFKRYRGKYSASTVDHRALPDDDLIREWFYQIKDERWRWVFGVLASYGVRNHEPFHIDLETIAHEPLIWVEKSKTIPHFGLPFPLEWWEEFKLYEPKIPSLTPSVMGSNAKLSTKVSGYFLSKMKPLTLPFTLLDLRHRWSIRTAEMGIDSQLTSKLQAHSQRIHDETYQRNTDERTYRDLMNRFRLPAARVDV
jgi:hypothetical protein